MEVTPRQLADLVGGTVEGDSDCPITGFAPIEEAENGSITFLANPKYTHHIYNTKASAVLVAETFQPEHPVSATLIRVKDPYETLARLMEMLNAMQSSGPTGIEQPCYIGERTEVPSDAYIGAFAYVGKDVRLGKGVKIYPQAYVGDGCSIGDGTVVRAGVRIYEGCRIGKGCIIHSGAVIGADGFGFAPTKSGYEKIPQNGIVVIEDDVEIGANTTIDRATFGHTTIGRGSKLDNLIQIAHNVTIGTDNAFAAQVGIAGSTRIGNGNVVGGQVGVAGHISIGDNNQIGAQSGIPNTVGSGNRIIGYPAVDARQFAKTLVYLKKLPELFEKQR